MARCWRSCPMTSMDHAVQMANDTVYGLAAYVQGRLAEAQRRGAAVAGGQVNLNYPDWDTFAPFGGYKQSGNGREYADWGIHDFCEVKAIVGYGRHDALRLYRAGQSGRTSGGQPACGRAIKVTVFDLDPKLAERHLAAWGRSWPKAPAELAAAVDHVFTCLPSPAVSEAVSGADSAGDEDGARLGSRTRRWGAMISCGWARWRQSRACG